MESITKTEIVKKLSSVQQSLFTVSDFKRLFAVRHDNTVYKMIARLTKQGIIKRLQKGKYQFSLLPVDDFKLANFLYPPSYISLESALSVYGIISQFPYQITSITTRKTRNIEITDKLFFYGHIKPELFWGYEKKDNFLLATRQKAMLDYLYYFSKGLRSLEAVEFNLTPSDYKKLKRYLIVSEYQELVKYLSKIC